MTLRDTGQQKGLLGFDVRAHAQQRLRALTRIIAISHGGGGGFVGDAVDHALRVVVDIERPVGADGQAGEAAKVAIAAVLLDEKAGQERLDRNRLSASTPRT